MKKSLRKAAASAIGDDLPTLNPLLTRERFSGKAAGQDAPASVARIAGKGLVLGLCTLLSAVLYWKLFALNVDGSQLKNRVGWPFFLSPLLAYAIHCAVSYQAKWAPL